MRRLRASSYTVDRGPGAAPPLLGRSSGAALRSSLEPSGTPSVEPALDEPIALLYGGACDVVSSKNVRLACRCAVTPRASCSTRSCAAASRARAAVRSARRPGRHRRRSNAARSARSSASSCRACARCWPGWSRPAPMASTVCAAGLERGGEALKWLPAGQRAGRELDARVVGLPREVELIAGSPSAQAVYASSRVGRRRRGRTPGPRSGLGLRGT